MTPKGDSPAYIQTLPAAMNLKEDIIVELAMLHKCGIITTLPFLKNASPIFAWKKPNGKLPLLVDMKNFNNLISNDYINNNHPVIMLKMLPNTWRAKNSYTNWTIRRHIIAYRWLTNDQLRSWPSISLAAHLLTDAWHEALPGRCLHFLVS